ncbi:MAG: TIGR02147 family protein [Fibrobacterota bacterium]|nr:TIGR02147 family protein [Fibrobacterota bacterium]QQS03750.1 MAG: TIGR02147 family protein [Fibrobacterota bacterium]
MPDLFQYTDYRAFLRDWFVHAKQSTPALSYRFLASRLAIDPGFLVHIFHGQKHLSETHLQPLVKALKLDKRQGEYFQRLVAFCKAKGTQEIGRRFAELMELRETKVREVSASHYRYYQNWYVPAIRCLVAARRVEGDGSELAGILRPNITQTQAREAVALLAKLGMIRKTTDGSWEPTDAHVTSGDAWTHMAIRSFQKQTLQLAMDAMGSLPKEEREISTMTLAIAREEMETVQEMVREFRAKLAKWAVGTPNADMVYQVNIQVFPLVMP